MRVLDSDGFLMCKIQGRIFEKSLDALKCSSPFFIKNYMQGDIARSMDICAFLNTSISEDRVLYDMRDLSYGSNLYTKEEMYFIGHFYRYVSYIYEIDSKKLYSLLPSRILIKYAYTWSLEGPDKVLYEIEKDYHVNLNNEDLLIKTQLNISNKLNNIDFINKSILI